jgi:nucleoside-diphosphate-sugar epimerase
MFESDQESKEILFIAFKQKFGLDYTILRFFNTYGPGQKNNFAITKFINLAKQNKKIIINGNGNQLRSYMYVSDAANASIKASISIKCKNQILNIGNGNDKKGSKRSGQWSFNFYPSDLIKTTICQKSNQYL